MMKRCFALLTALGFLLACQSSDAGVIAQADFNDTSTWDVSITASGSATSTAGAINAVSPFDSILQASKSGGSGGVRITAELIGAISTIGFNDIRLSFVGSGDGLEWNGNLSDSSSVASSDGLRVSSSQGIKINANSTNDLTGTLAEDEFESGATFPTANFASDFSFDSSVDNSQITDLTFTLQINANAEQLQISQVKILGTPIRSSVIPEPNSLAIFTVGLLGLARRRRSRR